MKKTFVLFAMLIASISLQAQSSVVSDFIAKYENDDQFTSVFVSPKMFDMFSKVVTEEEEKELHEIIKDLKGLQIITTKNDPMAHYKSLEKNLNSDNFDLLMKVKDEGENVRIFSKGSGDVVDEIAVLVGGTEEFVLLSLVGKLDLNKIGKLAEDLDLQGAEHLKNLGK